MKKYQVKIAESRYQIARKITTNEGFYALYFEALKKFTTQKEAFNYVNDLHYDIVIPSQYKYTSYETFKVAVHRNGLEWHRKLERFKSEK